MTALKQTCDVIDYTVTIKLPHNYPAKQVDILIYPKIIPLNPLTTGEKQKLVDQLAGLWKDHDYDVDAHIRDLRKSTRLERMYDHE